MRLSPNYREGTGAQNPDDFSQEILLVRENVKTQAQSFCFQVHVEKLGVSTLHTASTSMIVTETPVFPESVLRPQHKDVGTFIVQITCG